MVDPATITYTTIWALVIGAVCVAILYAAYQSYVGSKLRSARPKGAPLASYADELARLNRAIDAAAQEGRLTLERTRDAVRAGTRG